MGFRVVRPPTTGPREKAEREARQKACPHPKDRREYGLSKYAHTAFCLDCGAKVDGEP